MLLILISVFYWLQNFFFEIINIVQLDGFDLTPLNYYKKTKFLKWVGNLIKRINVVEGVLHCEYNWIEYKIN